MIEYEILSMPFMHDDSFNPLTTILPSLSPDGKIIMFIIKGNSQLSLCFQIDNDIESMFCQEMERSGFIIKKRPISNYFTHYSIKRDIPNKKEVWLPITTDDNKIEMLLKRIEDSQTGIGLAFVFRGRNTLRRRTVEKINELNLNYLFSDAKTFTSYGFSCHPIAANVEDELSVAETVVSCFEGLSYSDQIKADSVQNISNHSTYSYNWQNELSKVLIETELKAILPFLTLLNRYIKTRNIDTLNSTRSIERPEINTNSTKSIQIGTTFGDEPILIPLKTLRQNVFIAGAPGTGKGNLIVNIAEQLYNCNDDPQKPKVNFLIIESAKKELHHLRKIIPELQVWRPEPGRFVLNPFALPEDLSKLEYGDSLQTILKTCFDISTQGSALRSLFPETLNDCFIDFNFSSESTWENNPDGRFGINEFITEFTELMKYQDYSVRTKNDITQAGLNRANALISTQKSYLYDSINTIPVKQLISGFNVLQLEPYLGSVESKQLFVTILLIQINAWLRFRFKNTENNDLNLVIIIDESHNVLKNIQNPNGGTFSFVEDFQKNLLEHRSSGIGYIISDQSAKVIPEQIISQCATKIFLGANLDSGIENYRLAFQLSDEDLHNFYRFKAGEGVIHSYGFESAVPFHTTGKIEDLEVTSEYEIKNSYIDSTRITIESFKECAFCDGKGQCSIIIKEHANTLAQKFLNKKKETYEALKKFAEAIKGSKERKAGRDNLRRLLKEFRIENQIDVITCNCFLQQLFRIFKRENGQQEADYQDFIRGTNKGGEK